MLSILLGLEQQSRDVCSQLVKSFLDIVKASRGDRALEGTEELQRPVAKVGVVLHRTISGMDREIATEVANLGGSPQGRTTLISLASTMEGKNYPSAGRFLRLCASSTNPAVRLILALGAVVDMSGEPDDV